MVRNRAILLGIFLLIQFYAYGQGCNCPPVNSCGPCQGGFTSLTLRYNGGLGVAVSAADANGTIFFALLMTSGQTFTVNGSLPSGRFAGNQLSVFAPLFNFTINTNCVTPVSVGQTFGSFTVLAAQSFTGGQLCCDIDDLEIINPVISGCPSDIQVSSDVAGCSKAVSWTPPTASDNCGDVTLTSTHNPGAIFPVGTTEVIYTATDDYGNTAICNFDVIVTDDTDPVIAGCPADIVVSADASCEAIVSWTAPTATDNCGAVSLVSSHNPGDVFPKGTTSVLYTATDAAGNISTCTFDVTVTDDTYPVIAGCPVANIVAIADGSCGAVVSWTAPTAADNCAGLTFTSSHEPGDTFPAGTTTVLYTATDLSGNVSTCSFDILVNDDTDPVITGCPASNIVAVANAGCQAVVNWTAPAVSDNCSISSWVSSHEPGDIFDEGTTVVTYTATDAAGNFATCSFNVIVNDETDPVITGCIASDIIVTANALCQATVSWTAPSASDNCGPVTMTSNFSPGHVFSLGTTQVIYTAEDGEGNISTCEFNVIVQDDTDPVIVGCPAADIVASANASCQAVVSWPAPAASDNCFLQSFTSSHDPGDIFPLGTTVVLYTAEDAAGNIATCSFNVVVNDDTDPVIAGCITADIVVPANSSCQAVVSWTAPTVTDNCGPVTMISSHNPGNTFSLGTTVVTYTATDGFSNTSTCIFNVIVEDQTPPAIVGCVPIDITVPANAACEATATWTPPTATDNCSVTLTSTHDPGDTFPFGTTAVTYTAADGDGNIATCTFNVIVKDETNPVFAACIGTDIVVFTDASCQATATWTPPTATDNCSVESVNSTHTPGSIFSLGTTQVTYTATDGSGNTATCVFNVVVEDNTPPVIAACISTDIVGVADAFCGTSVSWTPPTATDNCGSLTLTSSHEPGATFSIGTTVVTYTATDDAGNISTCSFNVIVKDETNPVFAGCISSDIVVTANSSCEATATWTPPTATDNCSIASLVPTHAPGSIFPSGTTLVTYIATDVDGNIAECSFKVIVEDVTDPVISGCPVADIILNADAGCQSAATWTAPVASDNCSAVALTSSHSPGDAFPIGTTQVIYTATDDFGNTSVCTFNVIVRDTTDPVITGCFTSDVTAVAISGCQSVVTWVEPVVTDNCGIVTVTSSHVPGDIFPIGRTTVTYIATDASGNSSECSFDVVVTDGAAPVLASCQDVIATAGQACEVSVSWATPAVTDCSSVTLVSSHNSGDFFSTGSTEVTYTATDSHGNSSSCTFKIIVEDKTPPVIQNCVNNLVINVDSECDAIANWTAPATTDNCEAVTLVSTHSPGSTFPLGTTTVVYTATDDSGNTAVCEFKVTVRNATSPVFENCPDDITVTGNESGEAVAEWTSPSAASPCSEVTVTRSHNSGDIFRPGTTRVEYNAVDISGNVSRCWFNVTVIRQEIDIEISKVVTPDGNGVNDELIITNIEKFTNNKIVIVDRWGSVIYTASGYNNGSVVWRGINRDGAMVPTGTYFYSISVRYGEDFVERTGFIELIR